MANSESIGSLVARHWQSDGLELNEMLRLLELLPRDAGPGNVQELEAALLDLSTCWTEFADETVTGPEEANNASDQQLGDAFLKFLSPTLHQFSVPIGRGALPEPAVVGGRYELTLCTNNGWLELAGAIKTGHNYGAIRFSLGIAEEFGGCLWANGLLEHRRMVLEDIGGKARLLKPTEMTLQSPSPLHEDGVYKGSIPLSFQETERLRSFEFGTPIELTDLERTAVSRGKSDTVIGDRLSLVSRLFSSGGPPLRRLRTAARFARRALTCADPSESFLNCAIAMESLMVAGSDAVLTRLRDAVALRLGESMTEREEIRSLVKRIYEVRSKFLHDGDGEGTEAERLRAIFLLRRLLAAELRIGE